MYCDMKPIHPWKILAKELKYRKRSQKYFAELIEKTPEEISYLLTWKRNFTVDIAMRVWYALWTSYELRLWLQNDYDSFLLRHSEKNNVFDRIKSKIDCLEKRC